MVRSVRSHFIVKHGLDSLKALPNYVWRTDQGPNECPRGFGQVKLGDRWISFAYTTSDRRERTLSLITGFYECTQEKRYGSIPLTAEKLDEIADGKRMAWLIEGKEYKQQPREPVGVPPIDDLIRRRTFKQATLIPITAEEFEGTPRKNARFPARHRQDSPAGARARKRTGTFMCRRIRSQNAGDRKNHPSP